MKRLITILPIIIFALAVAALHQQIQDIHFSELRAEWQQSHQIVVLWAIFWTALNYVVLSGYDYLSLLQVGIKLPYKTIFRTSCAAFSLSNFVGHSIFSGGSIRMQEYGKADVPIHKIAQVAVQNSISFWTGFLLLLGISFSTFPPHSPQMQDFYPIMRHGGVICTIAVSTYLLVGTLFRDRVLVVGRFEFVFPTGKMAFAQLAVAVADLVLCSTVFYYLLPQESVINFPEFLSIFLCAQALGVISQVPGGLGVFDGALLALLLPFGDSHRLLFTIVLFRVIYYLLPFSLATVWYFFRSFSAIRGLATKGLNASRGTLQFVVPQLMAIGILIAGSILLLSSFTPAAAGRLQLLNQWLPLPIIELAHLSASVTGVILMLLAREIMRRSNRGFKLVLALLIVGSVCALFKGFDWEEAGLLLLAAMLLAPFEPFFYRRRPDSNSLAVSFHDFEILGLITLITIAGFFAYANASYDADMLTRFHLHSEAARFVRGAAAAFLVVFLFFIGKYLRSRPSKLPGQLREDFSDLQPLLARVDDSEAQLVLVGDKRVITDSENNAFLMYDVLGSTWVALGDVYGSEQAVRKLTLEFMDMADREGCRVVFYQVRERFVAVLVELGFRIVKLGDEAQIPLSGFTLEGHARKELRAAVRRGEKDGLVFEVISPDQVAAALPELRAISDAWLLAKGAKEKRFSVGRFEDKYICRLPCAVVRAEGKIVAFANLWLGAKTELSVDLMRYDPATAPKGTMDFLFVSLLLWGRDQGFKSFNLGMAPLSGLEVHAWSPSWYKLANLAFRYGEKFYNFRGLREYKEKYNPIWKPKFLAVEPGMSIIRATSDVTLLVSGGARGFLGL